VASGGGEAYLSDPYSNRGASVTPTPLMSYIGMAFRELAFKRGDRPPPSSTGGDYPRATTK